MPYVETGNKNYEIQRLGGRHKKMLNMHAAGISRKEIAAELGVSTQTISHIINSELGKQHLDMLTGAADSEALDLMISIRAFAPVALSIQQELALDDGTTSELKNKIADKMLDRAGYVPIQKNLNMNVNTGLKKEDLDLIKKRALEIKELTKVEEDE